MIDPGKTSIFLGPPGTGKTTKLLSLVESELAAGTSPREIGFISFTKKAAEEGKERAVERFGLPETDFPHFKTLHAMAFRHLGMSRDRVFGWQHVKELGQRLGMEFKGKGQAVDDDAVYGMNSADRCLFLEGLARNRMQPLREAWSDAFEDAIDWWELERFSKAMEVYKESRGLVDFTDMLERFCFASPNQMPKFKMLVVDEAQDLSLLQWRAVELLAQNAERVFIGGDDDQCHPGDTPILTTSGYVTVENLDPEKHKLVYWRRDTHCFHGMNQDPGEFQIAARQYDGELIGVAVDGDDHKVEFTPDHRLVVRLVDHSQDWRCVYLMKRGKNFRVGQCQFFSAHRGTHIAVRMGHEEAEAIWILKLSKDEEEILVYEQLISLRYSLPQACFKPPSSSGKYQRISDSIFSQLETEENGNKCLIDHALLPNKPFFTPERAREKSGGTSIFKLEACNLLPELMALPKIVDFKRSKPCAWRPFTVSRRQFSGTVHSLGVERWHTYVAKNIAVANCLYNWAGADVGTFISLKGASSVLDVSYRVPASVHKVADSITRRIGSRRPKTWRPRDVPGSVNWFGNVDEVDMSKGSWLLLARNGYMLDAFENWCLSQGFSFHSVNRDPLKSPALQAIKVWENLRRGENVAAEQVLEFAKYMTPLQIAPSLVKKIKTQQSSEQWSMGELRLQGLLSEEIWWKALPKISAKERDFFLMARKRGEPLLKKPRITISTIHAAKGGEADHVLLASDVSYRSFVNAQSDPDSEARVFYVAVTRCRESLNILTPRTNLAYEI